MTQERSSNGSMQVNDFVYIFAGWNIKGDYLRTVERHALQPGPDFEEVQIEGSDYLYGYDFCIYNDAPKIYIFGGSQENAYDIITYDVNENKFEPKGQI